MVMKDICPFTKKESIMYAFHNRQSRLLCTCKQEAGVLFQIQFWHLILSCCCCCRGINLVGAAIIGVWQGEQGGRGTLRAYVYKQISSQSLLQEAFSSQYLVAIWISWTLRSQARVATHYNKSKCQRLFHCVWQFDIIDSHPPFPLNQRQD